VEARHRAELMVHYTIILGRERLYKPTTWSVGGDRKEKKEEKYGERKRRICKV
jgi:hypothetical protein